MSQRSEPVPDYAPSSGQSSFRRTGNQGRGGRFNSQNRQSGRGGRGRGGGSSRQSGNNNTSRRAPRSASLKGDIEELKDNVYQIGTGANADRYTKTTLAIADYCGKTLTNYGRDIYHVITTLKDKTFTEPPLAAPANPAAPTHNELLDMKRWERKCAEHLKRVNAYEENKHSACNIILGQCTLSVRNKVESQADYQRWRDDNEVADLLQCLRKIM